MCVAVIPLHPCLLVCCCPAGQVKRLHKSCITDVFCCLAYPVTITLASLASQKNNELILTNGVVCSFLSYRNHLTLPLQSWFNPSLLYLHCRHDADTMLISSAQICLRCWQQNSSLTWLVTAVFHTEDPQHGRSHAGLVYLAACAGG